MAIDKVTSAAITDGTITSSDLASGTVQNQSAFKNIIINGNMSLAQRSTSVTGVTTTDGYYTCDRWYSQTDTGTWTISQSNNVPTGQGFYKSFKLDCTSAGTSNADEVGIRYLIEGQDVQHLKYGTSSADSLTLSFWIKTNKTGTYTVAFKNASSSQERIVSFEYTVSSADTWEKKTITLPGDTSQALENTNTSELEIYWYFSAAFGSGVTNTWQNYSSGYLSSGSLPGLGGSTDDNLFLTGVQLEVGTSASDFEFLPFDVNRERCLRYCQIIGKGSGNLHNLVMSGYNGTICYGSFHLEKKMRAVPSVSFPTTSKELYNNGSSRTISSLNTSTMSENSIAFNIGGSGWSAGQSLHFNSNDPANGFAKAEAEL